jgi:chromosome segregation ATPase
MTGEDVLSTKDRLSAALDERIAAAFGDGVKSSEVAELIAEAETASIACGEAADRARTLALDPALSAADLDVARGRSDGASFKRDRMVEAAHRLRERLREVKAQEEKTHRRAAYDTALAERDKLAKELAAVYPPIAEQLADLAGRIAANDVAIERVNQKLPDGAKWLANAELVARQLSSFFDGPSNIPRIAQHMRLPAFKYSGRDPYTWPRPI